MSIVSVTYARCLSTVERLALGEWTDQTASGRIALCCKECGQIYDLSEFHRVEDGGLVVPAVRCASDACLTFGYVRLKDYGEAVVPA